MLLIPKIYKSPSKINRFLYIGPQGLNGKHAVLTGMQFLKLSDVMRFRVTNNGLIKLKWKGRSIQPPQENNLILRAAHALKGCLSAKTLECGVEIQIKKRIPIGAGLGGGSSNAATTLIALNHLWETGCSETLLNQIGFHLGSDIPFFLKGRSALVFNQGEYEDFFDYPQETCIVIPPIFGAQSTEKAFQILKEKRKTYPHKNNSSRFPTIKELPEQGHNDFEEILADTSPKTHALLKSMRLICPTFLTGTGNALIACCKEEKKMLNLKKWLQKRCITFYTSASINRSPVFDSIKNLHAE